MTEEIVERTDEPVTTGSLASDIRALGVDRVIRYSFIRR